MSVSPARPPLLSAALACRITFEAPLIVSAIVIALMTAALPRRRISGCNVGSPRHHRPSPSRR